MRRPEDLGAVESVLRGVGDDDVRVDRPPAGPRSRSTAAPRAWPTTVRELADRRLEVDDVGLRRPTLDEVFLTLTGRPAADAA